MRDPRRPKRLSRLPTRVVGIGLLALLGRTGPVGALDCRVEDGLLQLPWGQACTVQLAMGGEFDFGLDIGAAEYFQFNLTAPTLDLNVAITDPRGERVLEKSEPAGSADYFVFAGVSETAGRLEVSIRATAGTTAGELTLELEKRRPAGVGDPARARAEMAYWDGSQVENLGRLDESLLRYREAVVHARSAGAPELEVQALIKLGRVLRKQNDGSAADEVVRTAEAIAFSRLPAVPAGNDPLTAPTVDLAIQALRLTIDQLAIEPNDAAPSPGDSRPVGPTTLYLRAQPWAERLWLAEREDGKLLGELAATAAQASRRQRDSGGAQAVLCQTLELLERDPRRRERRAARFARANLSLLLAVVALDRWDTAGALGWAERSRDAAEQLQNDDLRGRAANLFCVVQTTRGELSLAHRACQRAVDTAGANRELSAQAHDNLGAIFLDLGRPDRAAIEYELALAQYPMTAAREIANVVRNLGVAAFRAGRLDEARNRFEQAEQTAIDAVGRGLALHWSAKVDLESDKPAEALAKLDRALELERQIGDALAIADTELERASALARLARPDEARQAFERTLAAVENDVLRKAIVLGRRADDLGRLPNPDREQALTDATAAVEIIEKLRTQVGTEALRRAFFAHRHAAHATRVRLLLGMGREREAFESAESARARGLLDLLAEKNAALGREGSPDLREAEAHLHTELEQGLVALAEAKRRRVDSPEATAEIARLQARIAALETEQERLQERTWREDPRYAEIRYPKPLTLDEIHATLDPETALLQYLIGGDGAIYLFAVTRDRVAAFVISAYQKQLPRLGRDLRTLTEEGLARGLWSALQQRAARTLYERLVAPASDVLVGKSRLIIAPDGALYGLPFEVLLGSEERTSDDAVTGAREAMLVERFVLSYAPSASVLARLAPPHASDSNELAEAVDFVAFADPAYSSAPALPATRTEVETIAALFPAGRSRLFLGEQANERNVRDAASLLGQARYLHFATHGDLLGEQPDLVGLRLAPEPPSSNESLLQAREILDLRLPRTELVVLSACSSGQGQRELGEGIVGLPRAFFSAGARSVAVSLWPVADQKTARFMLDFYRELLATPRDKADALRRAKLLTRSRPDIWSPFILVGAPR